MIPRLLTLGALGLTLIAARSDPLAGRVAGSPAQCIPLASGEAPTVLDGDTIAYHRTGRRLWVTHPVGGCRSLRPLSTLIVEVNGGQLCRNDRFRTIEPGDIIPSASCRFGAFVPYDLPHR